jgi:lipid-binding SYLF domain-containing protein
VHSKKIIADVLIEREPIFYKKALYTAHNRRNEQMQNQIRTITTLLIAIVTTAILSVPRPAMAADASAISRDAHAALNTLYESELVPRLLREKAKAVLVFPSILKAGFIIGGQGGNGALIENGKTVAYYNISAASYGLQAGVQEFGYAMFLMTDSARAYIDKSKGWEIGVGPTVVVVDAGAAKSLTTTTAKDDVYAFIFSQKGLMAGIGIQGSKITRINP